MSRAEHFASCANCIYYDNEHGCNNGISWLNGAVPANAHCHSPVLYRHPDGQADIYHDAETNHLIVESETTGKFVVVPIGKHGLLELAQALIALALRERQQ